MRKVFLEDLPKWDKGYIAHAGTINWAKCIGKTVEFVYDDIVGTINITDYDIKKKELTVDYLDNKSFKILTDKFKDCKIGRLIGKITSEYRVEIETTFKDDKRDITIIDRKQVKIKRKNNYIEVKRFYKYRCNKCGFDCGKHYRKGILENELWIEEVCLLNLNNGCSCCCTNPQIVVEGINDIPTTTPWMVKYFQGGYDKAKQYTRCSHTKIYPICPDCGRIKNNQIFISAIYNSHSIGCSCSDGRSYPEKIIHYLLEQLKIEFITEYSPTWCKYKNESKQGKYDFYFELDNQKYIIEADGGFHSSDNKMNGVTKDENKTIDDEKDKLALENNIEVIRIDCVVSDLDYIRKNILHSRLNKIFDLSIINWKSCEEFALSNLVKVTCEYKVNNPDLTTTEIGNMLNLHRTTVCRYLKKGSELNWCEYKTTKHVAIMKDGLVLKSFSSSTELQEKSLELFGVKLNISNISKVCNGDIKQYKGYTFKYINNNQEVDKLNQSTSFSM